MKKWKLIIKERQIHFPTLSIPLIKFKVTLQAKDGDNLVAAPFTVEFDIVGQQGYTVRNQRVI